MSFSTEVQGTQFATKWNELITGNENVTANRSRKESKPTLVLSVIGDSCTLVPNQWPKDVFQEALIETAKCEKETWILYRGSTDNVSKVVKEAYQHYKAMEFETETKAISDQEPHIKLINTTAIKEESSSTDAKRVLKKEEDDLSFLDFETFVSKQKQFYFNPDLEFEIPIPTVVIVCEGDIQTISHISKALNNQLPVIIMKGSGKAADFVLDYLDNCSQLVLRKKFSLFFRAKLDGEEYYQMKKHLENIEQNRELERVRVGVFDLNENDPLMLSGIVGEAVVSFLSTKNIVPISLDDLFKKVIKDDPQSEGHMRELPIKFSTLFNGLYLGTREYVMNPRFSTPTSLPLYFYLGYKVLQENEELMKDCGKVLLFEALKANRCEYVSSLMDQGVKLKSKDLQELYRGQIKEEKTLVKSLFEKKCAMRIVIKEMENIPSVQTVTKACRNFLGYIGFDSVEKNPNIGIGDVLLWAIIFNRRELAEICWLRGKDHLLTGLICSVILKKLSEAVHVIDEDVLADALEEHSKIFEQRCTYILDKMSDENTDQAISLLEECASVWGICSSPLTFAYENSMYDVVAHTCVKKYVKKTYLKPKENIAGKFLPPRTRYIWTLYTYLTGLIFYSLFVLTSTGTEYSVQGRTQYLEYIVYLWRLGDFLEEIYGYSRYTWNKGCSRLRWPLHMYKYLTFWNVLDLLSHFTLVLALFLRHFSLSEGQIYARNMYAISLLFVYLRVLEVFLNFKNTGTTVIMIKEMLKDLRQFIYIILSVVLSVGIYYHANLWPDHQTMWSGHLSDLRIWTILSHPYWQIFGEVDLEYLTGSNQDNCSSNNSIWQADPSTERCPQQDLTVQVIAGLYMMFTNILLVNIIIAKLSNTFERIHTDSEKIWYFHLYTVVIDYSDWVPSPFNLIYHPLNVMYMYFRSCPIKVADSAEITKIKKYRQALQKTVALRKHVKATTKTFTVDSQLNASH